MSLCLACFGKEGGCIHRPSGPWIPSPEEMAEIRTDLDNALSERWDAALSERWSCISCGAELSQFLLDNGSTHCDDCRRPFELVRP